MISSFRSQKSQESRKDRHSRIRFFFSNSLSKEQESQLLLKIRKFKRKQFYQDQNSLQQMKQKQIRIKNSSDQAKIGRYLIENPYKRKNIEKLKIQIKNVLMRMTYKQKLIHIKALIAKGRYLCRNYGYFYVTCAMVVYCPDEEIKLSIWIHPNLKQNKCIHPINKSNESENQKAFYYTLKKVISHLFPTIPLGTGTCYPSLITHINSLEKKLQKRLWRSSSLRNVHKFQNNFLSFIEQISCSREEDHILGEQSESEEDEISLVENLQQPFGKIKSNSQEVRKLQDGIVKNKDGDDSKNSSLILDLERLLYQEQSKSYWGSNGSSSCRDTLMKTISEELSYILNYE